MKRVHAAWLGLCVVVAAAAATSCSSGGGGGPSTKTIGATGGSTGSTDGAKIDVPSGAVGGDTTFTVTPAPSAPAPSTATPVGTAYTLGPEGAQFQKPVTVTLAVDVTKLPSGRTIGDVAVYTAPAGSSSYTRLGTRVVDPTHVAAETLHFSTFVPGVPMTCSVTCARSADCQIGGSCGTSGCTCQTTCTADGRAPTCTTPDAGSGSGGGSGGGSGSGSGSPGSDAGAPTGGGPTCEPSTTYSFACVGSSCTCNGAPTATVSCDAGEAALFAAYQGCGFPGELAPPPPPPTDPVDAGTPTANGCAAGGPPCPSCSISCMAPQNPVCTNPVVMSDGMGHIVCVTPPSCFCQ